MPVCRNELTTFRRLIARILRWPLPSEICRCRRVGLGREVERLEATLDRLRAHVGLEVLTEAVLELVEDLVFALEGADLEGAEVLPHLLEPGDLVVEGLADARHVLLGGVLDLLLLVGLGALFLERRELLLQLAARRVAMRESRRSPSVFSSRRMLFSCVGEVAVTRLLVDGDHHVGGEVDDLLEVLRRHVQQVARGATGRP